MKWVKIAVILVFMSWITYCFWQLGDPNTLEILNLN